MPEDKTSTFWTGCAALGVLLGGYVGAYYAMVVPTPPWCGVGLGTGGGRLVGSLLLNQPAAQYRVPALKRVLEPMHQIDRRIRPHVWEP
jgi:hypothetical protein